MPGWRFPFCQINGSEPFMGRRGNYGPDASGLSIGRLSGTPSRAAEVKFSRSLFLEKKSFLLLQPSNNVRFRARESGVEILFNYLSHRVDVYVPFCCAQDFANLETFQFQN